MGNGYEVYDSLETIRSKNQYQLHSSMVMADWRDLGNTYFGNELPGCFATSLWQGAKYAWVEEQESKLMSYYCIVLSIVGDWASCLARALVATLLRIVKSLHHQNQYKKPFHLPTGMHSKQTSTVLSSESAAAVKLFIDCQLDISGRTMPDSWA